MAKKRPEDFASDLHDELYLLNRQGVSAANRLQALEAYFPYVSRCAELLEKITTTAYCLCQKTPKPAPIKLNHCG